MQLPRGITGIEFSAAVDVRAFRTVLYGAACDAGFAIDQPPSDSPEPYHSFVQSFVSFRDERWRLLLNLHHPFVGFTTPVADVGGFTFCDCDGLATNLFGYTVLAADTLNTPATERAIALLSDAEHKEIAYWQPQRLGDVIFNFWN